MSTTDETLDAWSKDMSTTAYKIEVMQWFEDGNPIEFEEAYGWQQITSPTWNWFDTNYRKKIEPIECWVTVLDGRVASTVYMNKEDADAVYDSQSAVKDRWSIRKVVIE